jgi:hypothetical protein
MTPWGALLVVLAVLGAVTGLAAALYGLHRLCLWLESKGHLYYLHKQPEGSSPAACLGALQEVLEPQTRHVFHIREEKRHAKEEAPGQNDPPSAPGIPS